MGVRGRHCASLRAFDDAETKYRRAIEINPNNATARHWYSDMLAATGRVDESLAQIERAVALDPLSSVIRHTLGEALERKGRFQDAENAYRKAATIDPLRPGSYLALSDLTAYALGRPADAVPLARKAMALDPGGPVYVVALAALLDDLGESPEAMRLTMDAVRRWPDSEIAQWHAMALQATAGDLHAAGQSARKVLAIDPRNESALYILAVADLTKGDARTARARYAKARPELLAPEPPRIDGSNDLVALDLASVLLQTGDDARARQLLDGSEGAMRQISRLGWRVSESPMFESTPCAATRRKRWPHCAKRSRPAGVARFGVSSATSTRPSPRSATSPSSRRCSPTSSATWRYSAPNSRSCRRTRRRTLRQLLESLDPSTNSVRSLGSQVVSIQGVTGCRRGRRLVLCKYSIRDELTPSRGLRRAAARS